MSKNNMVKAAETHVPKQVDVLPPIKVGTLNNIKGKRLTHGRIIRAVARGEIPVNEASKMSYMLTNHAKIVETETLEARLDRLELAAEQSREIR